VVVLRNLKMNLRCQVITDDVASDSFPVQVIDSPRFATKPTAIVAPPPYLHDDPKTIVFDDANAEDAAILRYSKIQFVFSLDRLPREASLVVKTFASAEDTGTVCSARPVAWTEGSAHGLCELIASQPGSFAAELSMQLEHDLSVTLPVGRWSVH